MQATTRRALRDPALLGTVLVLWALLALFVLYPLGTLLARIVWDGGHFSLAGLRAVVTDPHQIQAFWNSLLLGALVGVAGTVLGFLFAFTAVRTNLPAAWLTAFDAATLREAVALTEETIAALEV